MQAELGVFIGENLGLGRPNPVCGLQAVHGVGSTEFAGLHHEGEQDCRQAQKE